MTISFAKPPVHKDCRSCIPFVSDHTDIPAEEVVHRPTIDAVYGGTQIVAAFAGDTGNNIHSALAAEPGLVS